MVKIDQHVWNLHKIKIVRRLRIVHNLAIFFYKFEAGEIDEMFFPPPKYPFEKHLKQKDAR